MLRRLSHCQLRKPVQGKWKFNGIIVLYFQGTDELFFILCYFVPFLHYQEKNTTAMYFISVRKCK